MYSAWVTLQRPPPDTLTLDRTFWLRSSMAIRSRRFISAALMAAKKPAAPPPTTIMSKSRSGISYDYFTWVGIHPETNSWSKVGKFHRRRWIELTRWIILSSGKLDEK